MGFTPVAIASIAFNMCSAVGIVFANKAVFYIYHFPYPVALTWIHVVFTAVGMRAMAAAGVFQAKTIPVRALLDLAAANVAYIVLGNLSIKLNPVGFYQIMKILIAPTILLITSVRSRTVPSAGVAASVLLLSAGIAIATVSDDQVMSNLPGILVGLAYVACTALYNIWVGSKQKQLEANSSQLTQCFSPIAAAMLTVLLPVAEPGVLTGAAATPRDALGNALPPFALTAAAAAMILVSAVLGLLVTLSTFLVIGHTSALTYNVVGHVKTVSIITGGVLLYGEHMSIKKLGGLAVAAAGIAWYSIIKSREADHKAKPEPRSG